jgi:serine/threonine protein kinase
MNSIQDHKLPIEEGKDYDDFDESRLPYTLLRNLGHGHSANVEEVRDELTKVLFARKTIKIPHHRLSKQERSKVFHNEVKIIRALGSHHHIISVFATYVTKRHFALILQPLASDGDLEDFLAEYWNNVRESKEHEADEATREKCICKACISGHGVCDRAESAKALKARLQGMESILKQAYGCLAAGLAFMHGKKVRHKDVKPRNILVHNGLMIYTDFGYSFDSNGFSRSTTVGRPGFLTRKYSAPEVLGYEDRNSKSDVYSLGCVFIDLLSALTQARDHDDIDCHSHSMDAIHQELVALKLDPPLSSLPELILQMTMIEPSQRLCAADVAIEISTGSQLCCKACRLAPLDGRNEQALFDGCVISNKTRLFVPEHTSNEECVDVDPTTNKISTAQSEQESRSVQQHGEDESTPIEDRVFDNDAMDISETMTGALGLTLPAVVNLEDRNFTKPQTDVQTVVSGGNEDPIADHTPEYKSIGTYKPTPQGRSEPPKPATDGSGQGRYAGYPEVSPDLFTLYFVTQQAGYELRPGSQFFVEGRVFAMIYADFESESNAKRDDLAITTGANGQKIYSKILRYVVIKVNKQQQCVYAWSVSNCNILL